MANFQLSLKDVEEFEAGVNMRSNILGLLQGNKLGKVRIHQPIWNHVTQAFKEVGRIVNTCLRQPYSFFATVNAKQGLWFGFEEVGKVF